MGGDGSIFDHASEEFKKKNVNPAQSQSDTKDPINVDTPKKSKETPGQISDQEIRELFDHVYKLNDTVAKKLEDAYTRIGVSHSEISDFLENPSNFSDNSQWMKIQQARANMLGRLEKTIIFEGKDPQKKTEKEKSVEKKKKDETADKKRKGKTLGSRKGWMSM